MQTTGILIRRYVLNKTGLHLPVQTSIITISGAEAVVATESVPNQFGTSTLPFLLDDVGCNGSESNLLDCLPQHNCQAVDPKNENAGVHCLRKGIILFLCLLWLYHLQVNIILFTLSSFQESN